MSTFSRKKVYGREVILHKTDLWWQGSFRILLAHRKQLNVIHVFEKVFDFIVIIGFIGVNDRSIGKIINVILEGIHIPKTTLCQKRAQLRVRGLGQDEQGIKASVDPGESQV